MDRKRVSTGDWESTQKWYDVDEGTKQTSDLWNQRQASENPAKETVDVIV